MHRSHLERCIELDTEKTKIQKSPNLVNLETEIPEVLYLGMKSFISKNTSWDIYKVMSSALSSFLFQNGCVDRVVTENYLDDIFTRADA